MTHSIYNSKLSNTNNTKNSFNQPKNYIANVLDCNENNKRSLGFFFYKSHNCQPSMRDREAIIHSNQQKCYILLIFL